VETRVTGPALPPTGLYIHIPFCRRECFYCHFTRFPFQEELAGRYIRALIKEIALYAGCGYKIDTLYFGGGSPSLLKTTDLQAVISALRGTFTFDPDIEFTLEMNPEDVTPGKLRQLKELGIDRLSLGVQSFHAADLLYLRRTHTVEQGKAALKAALAAGFHNLNLDFIISLPGQTRGILEQNFLVADDYGIPHISAYILEGVDGQEERENQDHELYFYTRDILLSLGYEHYEVSNYSRREKDRSRHNLKYWLNREYIGLGLSASGFLAGSDYKNHDDFPAYFSAIEDGRLPIKEETRHIPDLRRIVMGLRLLDGLPAAGFRSYPEQLSELLAGGFLVKRGQRIAVHPDRILLLHELLTRFF